MSRGVLLIGYGKMGKELLALMPQHDMHVTRIVTQRPPDTKEGLPLATWEGSIPWEDIDIAIDFSSPEGIEKRCQLIIDHGIPLVEGTTGWEACRKNVLDYARKKGASLVWSNNFSIGLFLFKQIIDKAACLLEKLPEFDVALMEAHHRKKKDAPSGTLLSLKETILDHLPTKGSACSANKSPLEPNEIDSASLRVGHIPGYHSVWIDGPHETIQMNHSVRSRSVFADGALFAATELLKRQGVFSFDEILHHFFTQEK